uniref:Putative alpha/beta-hydrolase n=1 Tax=Moniliophthora roreri TaxID=221103 RepID=A0A0W0ETF2_MONRR
MAFTYRHQPVKSLYLVVGGLWLVLRIPYWIIRNLLPSWRPRRNWSLLRSFAVVFMDEAVALLLETSLPGPDSPDKLAKTPGFVSIEPVPDKLIVGDIRRFAEMNGVKTERLSCEARGEDLLFIAWHGVDLSASPSFGPTALTAEGLLQHCTNVSKLFAVEYRLASGPPHPIVNPFPACFLDVLAGYHYLVNQLGFSPENIIVTGDSCGGVLAYQLGRYCTSPGDSQASAPFPLPGGLLLLSPSADSALRPVPGSSMITNKRSDYTNSWFKARYSVLSLLGNALSESELDRPWLSPGSTMFSDEDKGIKGVFTRFPRTMIIAGEAEMGRDSMRLLRDRMEKEMGKEKVVYAEINDAPHDFLGGTLWEPERTIALKEIGRWIAKL